FEPPLEEPVAEAVAAVLRGEVAHLRETEEGRLESVLGSADGLAQLAPAQAAFTGQLFEDPSLRDLQGLKVDREEVRDHVVRRELVQGGPEVAALVQAARHELEE